MKDKQKKTKKRNIEDFDNLPIPYLSSIWLAEAEDSLFDNEIPAWTYGAEMTCRWEDLTRIQKSVVLKDGEEQEAKNIEIGSKDKDIVK